MEGQVIDNIKFNFLYIDKYSFGKNWVFPESKVPYNMLRYIDSGNGTFFIDDEEFAVKKGQIVYIPQGSRLSCYVLSENFSFTSIRFTNSVYFDDGDFLKDYYGIPNIIESKDEKAVFDKIYNYVKSEDPARMFFVRGYLEILIGTLISTVNKGIDISGELLESEYYNSDKLIKRIKKVIFL